jgi:type IV secretion system protein VirD4
MHYGHTDAYRLPVDSIVEAQASRSARRYFILVAVLALWCTSEYLAWRFSFARALGAPLYGHIYEPWAAAVWFVRFWPLRLANPADVAAIHGAFLQGAIVMGAGLALAAILARRARAHRIRTAEPASDIEGSARFANPREIQEIKRALGDDGDPTKPGIYIGAYENPETKTVEWLRDCSGEHVGLIAKTRSGKGVLLTCTRLSWQESMIINDPKAEAYNMTADFRKRRLKQTVVKIDPTCLDGTAARFNPLDEVRIGTEYEVADAQAIATVLVDPHGQGLDTGGDHDHWRKTSRAFLTAVILHVLYSPDIKDKSLAGVDRFLSNHERALEDTLQIMINTKHDPTFKRAWLNDRGELTATMPEIQMGAADMLARPDRERESVLSSAKSYLEVYRDPILAYNTSASDFSLEDIRNGERPMTVYLINYPRTMDVVRPYMRMFMNMVARYYTKDVKFNDDNTQQDNCKYQLLIECDEFTTTLGKLEIFSQAIAFLAGYKIRVILVLQDLAQLEAVYGKAASQAILSNLKTNIYFATNTPSTAQQISMMLGDMTVRETTRNKRDGAWKESSEQFRRRPLMKPEEIMRMRDDEAIILVTGQRPIAAKKLAYYREPIFLARCQPPPATSDRIPPERQARLRVLADLQAKSQYHVELRRERARIATTIAAANHAARDPMPSIFGQTGSVWEDDEEEMEPSAIVEEPAATAETG